MHCGIIGGIYARRSNRNRGAETHLNRESRVIVRVMLVKEVKFGEADEFLSEISDAINVELVDFWPFNIQDDFKNHFELHA